MSFLFNETFWSGLAVGAGAIAASAAVWALILAKRESAKKDRELEQFQSQAKENIATLNSRTEEAKATAEGFRLDIAKANERAALLEKQTADSRLEQERLKEQLSWRIIAPDVRAKLIEVLSDHKSTVNLAYVASDPESLYVAIQLEEIFRTAGWQTAPESRTYPTQIFWSMFINGKGNEAQVVRNAFEYAGLPFSNEEMPLPLVSYMKVEPAPPVLVFVGSKRPPFVK